MTENPDSDRLWNEFVSSLYNDSLYEASEEEEEERNDPEWMISEELLQLEDNWDFRDDRAVKVTEYELDLLLDEDEVPQVEADSMARAVVQSNPNIGSDVFDEQSVRLLVTQFTQHIQLLTQTYIQSLNTNDLKSVAKNAKQMLNEINEKYESKSNPLLSAIHIKPAIRLISEYPIESCGKTRQTNTSLRTLPVTKENQRVFASNAHIFRHSWLLPYCGYYDRRVDKSKTIFTLAEDHLIALGLEQFRPSFSLRKCYRFIKQLLLPNKTVDQIRTHMKNIRRRSVDNENPIMYYRETGRAPETHSGIIDPKLDTYLFCKNTPEWYKKKMANDIQTDGTRRQNSGISYFVSKSKFKNTGNASTMDRKKRLILPVQQSPQKQTNSIVKKYKYLNRLNPIKQTLTSISNTNSRTKKSSNDMKSTQIQTIEMSENNSIQTFSLENQNNSQTDDQNECENEKIETLDKSEDMNGSNHMNRMQVNNEKPLNENAVNEEDVEFDDESDLAALMTASSTITTKNRNKCKTTNDSNNTSVLSISHNRKEGRKSLAVKQRESTLQLLSFECNESDPYSQQKEELLVRLYLEKVRKSLSTEEYVRFLTLLSDFHQKRNEDQSMARRGLMKELYSQIEDFLKQSNVSKDIISEFVLFLSAEEAEECGKMFDYLYWKRFFNFVRKIEIYSSVDPQCLQRLMRSLNQLKQNEQNLDSNRIRATVSRVLNGHSYLMHEFSSLFLDQKPSEYLFEDEDFDEIVVDSSDDEERNESFDKNCFENINIPENNDELKYGTNECPCSTCHTDPTHTTTHCTSCSIRFIGGRVYLTQNHKKLGLAEIHFIECDNNSNKMLENNENNKPNEEMIEEEVSVGTDNEIDCESNRLLEEKQIIWSISDDKMLLELCRSKVLDDRLSTELSEDVFEEVANRLSKDTNEVIARFNKLMELFASEQDSHRLNPESDL